MRIQSRQLARAIITTLAHHCEDRFCISTFYDYDAEFLAEVARKIGQPNVSGSQLEGAMRRVCRKLEAAGVLVGRLSSCHKEYLGEPTALKSYSFSDVVYKWRINPASAPHYRNEYTVDFEIEWLLERAYPL